MTVPSPCRQVCDLDRATGICTGCLRTLAEIGGWSTMRDADRQAILDRIAALPPQ